jgi:transcriptional regulator with XRE-family HTH domain
MYTAGIMELHLQVKTARKQARLTQEELAERANVGRTDVSRFERGENVTMKTFLRIVGALPELKDLTVGDGDLHLRKEGSPLENAAQAVDGTPGGTRAPIAEDEVIRRLGSAFLHNLASPNPPAAPTPPPAAESATPQDASLVRMLVQLVVELAGRAKL